MPYIAILFMLILAACDGDITITTLSGAAPQYKPKPPIVDDSQPKDKDDDDRPCHKFAVAQGGC